MLSINCDLGEWETLEETKWMLQRVDLANVACGAHAGSPKQMVAISEMAEAFGTKLGMHPGHPLEGGRGDVSSLSICEFYDLLEAQFITFEKYIGKPNHIKLHGSLYHLSESSESIRSAYLEFCLDLNLPIVALAGGKAVEEYRLSHGQALAEGFLDRNYNADGTLISRDDPNAILSSPEEALARYQSLRSGASMLALDGTPLDAEINTLCVHSDSSICREVLSLM